VNLIEAVAMLEWVKALHIIAVVSWMAGLLYLPRLLVYHCGVVASSEASAVFKVMERRLLKAIMRPAALVSVITGGYLVSLGGFSPTPLWLAAKICFVVLLLVFHGFLEVWVRGFATDVRKHGSRFFRVANEIPTVLLVLIVIFVVVKPFQ
jgi:protoporphyrinogen IX oxidase